MTAGLTGENRLVRMLFADMSGSVGSTRSLDPEDAALLVNELLQAMVAATTEYGGQADRFLGCGVTTVPEARPMIVCSFRVEPGRPSAVPESIQSLIRARPELLARHRSRGGAVAGQQRQPGGGVAGGQVVAGPGGSRRRGCATAGWPPGGPDRWRRRRSTSSHPARHTTGLWIHPIPDLAQAGTPVVWPTSIRWPSGSRM